MRAMFSPPHVGEREPSEPASQGRLDALDGAQPAPGRLGGLADARASSERAPDPALDLTRRSAMSCSRTWSGRAYRKRRLPTVRAC
jgi:hypothetical protein